MNANTEALPILVEYEMGYGADEFGRVLLGPFSGARSDFDASETGRHCWAVTHLDQAFELEISVSEMPPRKLGLFNLPVLAVKFSFRHADDSLREAFFHRFHQYFHKGGG
ncbi:MAG: hypothetical protein OEU50_02410 [Gammaproteobacteria bacterium]|nr:hypothetical protein [Gammaproteobacteria bacterium]